MLSETVSVRGVMVHAYGPRFLLPHMHEICMALDKLIVLEQKDEYELAMCLMENLLYTFLHVRPLNPMGVAVTRHEIVADPADPVNWPWGAIGDLNTLQLKWYTPGKEEMAAAQSLVERYLEPSLSALEAVAAGQKVMDKEELLRNLRVVVRTLQGGSEAMHTLSPAPDDEGVLAAVPEGNRIINAKPELTVRGGMNIREVVTEVAFKVQSYLLSSAPDDTESLHALVAVYDACLRNFAVDEGELYDVLEEHKSVKNHREDKLVRSKRHYEQILIDRVSIHRVRLKHDYSIVNTID